MIFDKYITMPYFLKGFDAQEEFWIEGHPRDYTTAECDNESPG